MDLFKFAGDVALDLVQVLELLRVDEPVEVAERAERGHEVDVKLCAVRVERTDFVGCPRIRPPPDLGVVFECERVYRAGAG